MGKTNVRLDYEELKKLKEQIMLFGDPTHMDQFLTSCAKELAARLLAKVIKRTPVGQYPAETGKKGGTLRRGWTGGKSSNAKAYANSLTVNKTGTDYVIEIINPVEYASYVEFGHRTRNHKGWIEGKFMLTISEDEIRNSAPRILENKLKNYLKGCFK
jgi:hypothetical protein